MKEDLLKLMNTMDFDIHDCSYEAGHELVAKKCWDGSIVWWPMEEEGSGFESLFKGCIKRACQNDNRRT